MLSVTKRVQIGTESSQGKGGMDGRMEGGGKNNPGLTEKEGGPVETDDLAHILCFSGRFCSGRKGER